MHGGGEKRSWTLVTPRLPATFFCACGPPDSASAWTGEKSDQSDSPIPLSRLTLVDLPLPGVPTPGWLVPGLVDNNHLSLFSLCQAFYPRPRPPTGDPLPTTPLIDNALHAIPAS